MPQNVLLSSFRGSNLEYHTELPAGASATSPTAEVPVGDVPAVAESDVQLLRPLAGLWRPPVTAKVSDFGLR